MPTKALFQFRSIFIGSPQVFALLLLLGFALQCGWLILRLPFSPAEQNHIWSGRLELEYGSMPRKFLYSPLGPKLARPWCGTLSRTIMLTASLIDRTRQHRRCPTLCNGAPPKSRFNSRCPRPRCSRPTQKAQEVDRFGDLRLDVRDVEAVGIGEDYMRKIVEELIDNAFKFSTQDTAVCLSAAAEGDFYVVSVTNQGRGMTQQQIALVGAYMQFERRIHEQQGAGLGLVICKRLAELHDGEFSIESVPGAATTIEVRLPLKHVELSGL